MFYKIDFYYIVYRKDIMELPNFKKILLLVSIAISFYIIYSLVQRRQTLMVTTESFQTSMATINPTVSLQYALKEYTIFSSWNSCALSDGNVSLDQLEIVFQNGCRFLDFEVYYIENKPVIGFSMNSFNQKESIQQIDSEKVIPFLDLCTAISVYSSSKCPNPSDPLFLHFRIKTNNLKIFNDMAEAFKSSGLDKKFYKGTVNEYTILSTLANKIVIVVDRTYVPNIKLEGQNMIQMFSGTRTLSTMQIQNRLGKLPRPLTLETDNETNTETVKMVTYPFGSDYEFQNSDKFATLVMKHSIQIVPHKFYSNDESLQEYKNFYSDNGHHAFITMGVAHNALSFNYE